MRPISCHFPRLFILGLFVFPTASPADDQAALLAAIRAQPAEDTPRLAYADWLDEHGEAKQAEFIRLQIEIARAATDDPKLAKLRERETKLADVYKGFLGLPKGFTARFYNEGFKIEWDRGFPSRITLRARDLDAEAIGILNQLSMLGELSFTDVNETKLAAQLPKLRPLLERTSSIAMSGFNRRLENVTTATQLQNLLKALPENIRHLDLGFDTVKYGASQWTALAESALAKELISLRLSGPDSGITSEGVEVLATALPKLRSLHVGGYIALTTPMRKTTSFPSLVELDMSETVFQDIEQGARTDQGRHSTIGAVELEAFIRSPAFLKLHNVSLPGRVPLYLDALRSQGLPALPGKALALARLSDVVAVIPTVKHQLIAFSVGSEVPEVSGDRAALNAQITANREKLGTALPCLTFMMRLSER